MNTRYYSLMINSSTRTLLILIDNVFKMYLNIVEIYNQRKILLTILCAIEK